MQTINLGQSIPFSVQGIDQFGNPFPIPADATYLWSDDAADVATLAPTDQPNGIATSVGEGTTDVTIVVTLADGTTKFTASDALTVAPKPQPVLSAVKIVWGTPTP